MSSDQFRKRTSALKIPEEIYQNYDLIVKQCETCQGMKKGPSRPKVSGMRNEVFGDLTFIDHAEVPLNDLFTRLKHVYSWNLNSWSVPDPPRSDPKTRRCRRLLRTGPVCLQETKWDEGVPEKLAGYLSGIKVYSTEGAVLDSGKRSGGVAILLPPGWKAEKAHELVPAKALALLVRDRLTHFYLVSVYLHPDSKKRDLEKLMQEWSRLEKDTARALWNSFLSATCCIDIDPKLITYCSQAVASPLDRCLLRAEWMASASWNPVIRTLNPVSSTGHKILRISMQLKPSVVNNPKDLPTDLGSTPMQPNSRTFRPLYVSSIGKCTSRRSASSGTDPLPLPVDNLVGIWRLKEL